MSVVKMKKVTLLGRRKDENTILQAVQKASLMHVVPFNANQNTTTQNSCLDQEIGKLKRSEDVLNAVSVEYPAKLSSKISLGEAINTVLKNCGRKSHVLKELEHIETDLKILEPWGDFSPSDIAMLEDNGVVPSLCIFETKNWDNVDKEKLTYSVINQDAKHVYVAILKVGKQSLPVTPIAIPKHSTSDLLKLKSAALEKLEKSEKKIASFCYAKQAIRRKLTELLDEKQFEQAKAQALKENHLFGVSGYIPANEEIEFRNKLHDQVVAVVIADPGQDEEVPVKLKNNGFFRGFESILHTFSGINYQEKDMTWTVGILFILFGSLCLLDAGYGLLLMATGLALGFKGQDAIAKVFMITGGASTILGLLGGQVFGLIVGKDFFAHITPPISLAVDPLACFIFSLIIGLVAMGFSYSVAIWQSGIKGPATGGLFFVFAVTAFAVGNFAVDSILGFLGSTQEVSGSIIANVKGICEIIGYVFLGLTTLSWLIFPDKVFGDARVPNIIWTLYSGVTGLMQDILSHMRLFGIALSGAILALVVNKIAAMLPLPATVLFAFVGHIFVFLLALLSLYIHTNRLIFLEFGSKCITGGHYLYTPFRRSSYL